MTDVARPVHLNRSFASDGLLTVKDELGGELLDAGASAAFAVADHQVAHVYVNDSSTTANVCALLEKPGWRAGAQQGHKQIPYQVAHDPR